MYMVYVGVEYNTSMYLYTKFHSCHIDENISCRFVPYGKYCHIQSIYVLVLSFSHSSTNIQVDECFGFFRNLHVYTKDGQQISSEIEEEQWMVKTLKWSVFSCNEY